jgi:hypothetical protein
MINPFAALSAIAGPAILTNACSVLALGGDDAIQLRPQSLNGRDIRAIRTWKIYLF